ncbi:MAG: hypothetical protein IPK74_03745 [Deltaproteobacteria bacterium]|nr:hypothetical protein [Deltaproteobacteria bacterium]
MRCASLLVTAAWACTPTASSSPPSATPQPAMHVVAPPTSQPEAPTPIAASPRGCRLTAGDHELDLEVAGAPRHLLLEVGDEVRSTPPVVFAWHGFGDSPWSAKASLASEPGWRDAIIVAPQGGPRTFDQFGPKPRAGWQVHAGELGDRDLAFFDAIVAELARLDCLDRSRVYSTGFSNGGFFTNVLACHRSEVLAAVAPAGGGGPFETCDGPRIPTLITHGRKDGVVPFAMAETSLTRWAARNGCSAKPKAPTQGCSVVPGCDADAPVEMCALAIDHVWPEGQSRRVTEFLRRFRKTTKGPAAAVGGHGSPS